MVKEYLKARRDLGAIGQNLIFDDDKFMEELKAVQTQVEENEEI